MFFPLRALIVIAIVYSWSPLRGSATDEAALAADLKTRATQTALGAAGITPGAAALATDSGLDLAAMARLAAAASGISTR